MRERNEFMTEREIFVLDHHPDMTYKAIGENLGISSSRVRQIKVHALRLLREEKRREQAAKQAQQPVTLTLKRKDLWILIRGLNALREQLLRQAKSDKQKQDLMWNDPDFDRTYELIHLLQKHLNP